MEIRSNIMGEKESKKIIRDTLNLIAESLSKTVGPYGSTTIIQDRQLNHFMTKDGYTVLKNIYLKDDIPRTILDNVKDISRRLVRTVGDGSTSSVLISNHLYTAINDLVDEFKYSPQDIMDILKIVSEILEEYIRKEAIPLRDDESGMEIIEKVATISTNNDIESGKFIRHVFEKVGKHGFITLENGYGPHNEYELIEGTEIPRGPVNVKMFNKGRTAEYEEPYIMMLKGDVTDNEMNMIAFLMKVICLDRDSPLVIIANNYSDSILNFFDANIIRNPEIPLLVIDMDTETLKGRDRFEDLSLLTSTDYYDKMEEECSDQFDIKRLGRCDKIISDDRVTRIMGKNTSSDKIDEKIKELKEELEFLENESKHKDVDMEIFEIRKRMAGLQTSMAVIKVGGDTEQEKDAKKFLMEDAVFACRSVAKNGYVIGGNLVVPYILEHNIDDIVDEMMDILKDTNIKHSELLLVELLKRIQEAFKESFKAVLRNSHMGEDEINKTIDICLNKKNVYNVKTREYENINTANVINSAETDIEITKSCFSLIAMLAVSNQFLSIN